MRTNRVLHADESESSFRVLPAAVLSFVLCFRPGAESRALEQCDCFVRRVGTEFRLNHCPFRFAGTNQYYQMIHRRGADRAGVNEVLDEMAARGLTVLRTWAFQDDASRADCLQCAPIRQLLTSERPTGFLSEATFRGLDELLVQASARRIRVILTLVNNWDDFGGMRRYSLWRFGPQGIDHDAFYNDPTIRMWFQEYVSRIVNRVNYLNGRRYRDDPTILAWELANEPRCFDAACRNGRWIDSWILEMSCYIKFIDPNHMVTTGIEGFYGPDRVEKNTHTWMSDQGTDFIDNHLGSCIDFATIHIWPENWGWEPIQKTQAAMTFAETYTVQRLTDGAKILGKPVVIEEFGIVRDDSSRCPDPGPLGPVVVRDQFYQMYSALCEEFASPDKSCAGTLIWMIYDGPSCAYDDGNGVFLPEDNTTSDIMVEHSQVFGTCYGEPGFEANACTTGGDSDFDCDVDLADFRLVRQCLSGPLLNATFPDCGTVDFVNDGHIDLKDVARLQLSFSGRCP